MWSWCDKYDTETIDKIIDNMLNIISEMVDDTYNCGNIADKESIIKYFTDIGFDKETVIEWYEWLDE